MIKNGRICKAATMQTSPYNVISAGAGGPNSIPSLIDERIIDLLSRQDSQLSVDHISDPVMHKLAAQKTVTVNMDLLLKKMKNEKHSAVSLINNAARKSVVLRWVIY